MDAHKISIREIFTGARKLEVPFYQRAYVWKEDQWERLMEDLAFISQTPSPYFMGSIILKKGKVNTWDCYADKKVVVDGQQRLTTLILFFKAFCLLSDCIDTFDKIYRLEDKEKSIALSLGMSDIESFNNVMSSDSKNAIDVKNSASNIIPAFNYFLTHIEIEKYNRNIIEQNLQFVCIDLDETEDEQQVFNTINSLGVRLTTAELLKNYFYTKEDIEQYKTDWEATFEKDDETISYWNQEIEAGRVIKSLIDVFFEAYFQLFIQNPDYKVSADDKNDYSRIDHIAQSYQEFIKKYCKDDKKAVLASMAEYANKFKELFDPSCIDKQMSKDIGINRINVIIFGLKNSTLIPYILYAAKHVSDNDELNRIYKILEIYIMRRIVAKETTKNYNNLFTSLILNKIITADDLIDKLSKDKDLSSSIPSDKDLSEGFKSSKLTNLQAKGIIYFIEAGIRPEMSSTALLGFKQYSLEHLMPKKWRNHWDKPAGESEDARDKTLLTLGNLAIITQALNASVRDSDWLTKKAGKKDNPGLDSCAAGLLTMENVLSESAWTETKIAARAEWLYEKAKNLWCICTDAS